MSDGQRREILNCPARDVNWSRVTPGMVPLEWSHGAAVETLPFYHRDPFDRLLVAEGLAPSPRRRRAS